MPFRNLNDMEEHDGTNQKIDFGGPYEIRVMLNGDDLYRGEVGKAHTLYVSMIPKGKDVEDPE